MGHGAPRRSTGKVGFSLFPRGLDSRCRHRLLRGGVFAGSSGRQVGISTVRADTDCWEAVFSPGAVAVKSESQQSVPTTTDERWCFRREQWPPNRNLNSRCRQRLMRGGVFAGSSGRQIGISTVGADTDCWEVVFSPGAVAVKSESQQSVPTPTDERWCFRQEQWPPNRNLNSRCGHRLMSGSVFAGSSGRQIGISTVGVDPDSWAGVFSPGVFVVLFGLENRCRHRLYIYIYICI